jgi:hypothetical protein
LRHRQTRTLRLPHPGLPELRSVTLRAVVSAARGCGFVWHVCCSRERAGGFPVSKLVVLASFFTLGLAPFPVHAEDPQGPLLPPQAAFDACQSKAAGDACQVSLPDRTLSGICTATPEGTLACRPDHPTEPTPEIARACEGKADGDNSTITYQDQQQQGVCRKGRSGGLVCLP